jgi:hypothetical protein
MFCPTYIIRRSRLSSDVGQFGYVEGGMVAYDFEALQAQCREDVLSYAGKVEFVLRRGWVDLAVEGYGILVQLMVGWEHDEMVALVNNLGVVDPRSSLIAKAWCQFHGVTSPIVEFETAFCWGENVGEVFSFRRGKKTWGAMVGVTSGSGPAPVTDARRNGDAGLRMYFSMKSNNPIRLRQATRNELKLWLGTKAVAEAMRLKRGEFVASFSRFDAARLERVTGLPLERIWSAIKNGDAELVVRLGMIPNPKREQMARKGMNVAEHVDPQGSLF